MHENTTQPATQNEIARFFTHRLPKAPVSDDKLSIVITSFQRPQRLLHCVESVTRQGITQIVISASGVRRCDLEMLKQIGEKYPTIRFTLLSTDLGCNELWLRGLYLARTPYVLLLHDDDTLAPDFASHYLNSIKHRLGEGIDHVLWDGQVVENGKSTSEVHRHLSGKTRVTPSATLLSKLLEKDGYAISPVAQIFNRQLAIQTLKECAHYFTQPEFFTRPLMMVGNDLLLTLRQAQACDQLLYIAKPLSLFGRWEKSESEWHRKRGSDKLQVSYNATRKHFLDHPRVAFPFPRNIIHVTNSYLPKEENTVRRHQVARTTWQQLLERGNWIPLDLEDSALPRNSSSIDSSIDSSGNAFSGVPFVKDLLDAAVGHACEEDILVISNSDTCIAHNANRKIEHALEKRDVAFSFRRDLHEPLREPLRNEDIGKADWYMGCDLFAMTPGWWRKHRDAFPDFLLGRPGWDWALRALMGLTQQGTLAVQGDVTEHSQFLEIPDLIYHEKHPAMHEQPENREHPANLYNLRLTFEFFNRYRPYPTWTRLMRRQFPSSKEFRRGRLGILRQSYHRTRTSYRTVVRSQLARRSPVLLKISDRLTAPIHNLLN